jgi:hypothetical protein
MIRVGNSRKAGRLASGVSHSGAVDKFLELGDWHRSRFARRRQELTEAIRGDAQANDLWRIWRGVADGRQMHAEEHGDGTANGSTREIKAIAELHVRPEPAVGIDSNDGADG